MNTYFCTHSFGVKVVFDCEAVHHAGGQAPLHTGHEQHQQGKDLEVHSKQNKVEHVNQRDSVFFLYLQFEQLEVSG